MNLGTFVFRKIRRKLLPVAFFGALLSTHQTDRLRKALKAFNEQFSGRRQQPAISLTPIREVEEYVPQLDKG